MRAQYIRFISVESCLRKLPIYGVQVIGTHILYQDIVKWAETATKIYPAGFSSSCYGGRENVHFNGATLNCDYPEHNEQVGISSIRCDDLPGVSSCKRSCKSTDDDSCKDFGLNIVIPRSRRHWSMLLSRYPRSTRDYFTTIPGIMKPSNKGIASNVPMNSKHRGIGDFQAIDGGPWWLRDTSYSEPNGDYSAYCWLNGNPWNVDAISMDDQGCNSCTDFYICSSNEYPQHKIMKKPSVGDTLKYELHVQVLIGEVPVRNFVGNDQYAPGTVEPLENQDIFYGIFSDEYFVSPSVQFLEDFRDVEHALQNTSRIEFYPILFAKCVHASELKLQTNQQFDRKRHWKHNW